MTIHVYCYKVEHPGLPNGGVWVYEDYEAAFQHVTGLRTDYYDNDEEREKVVENSEAKLTCFGWSR